MRIVIVGQQAFGKSVMEAFIARGDTIVGVFAAPERPGARPDPLWQRIAKHMYVPLAPGGAHHLPFDPTVYGRSGDFGGGPLPLFIRRPLQNPAG